MTSPSADDLCLDTFFVGKLIEFTGFFGHQHVVIARVQPEVDCRLAHRMFAAPLATQIELRLFVEGEHVNEEHINDAPVTAINIGDDTRFQVDGKWWQLNSIRTTGITFGMEMVRLAPVETKNAIE